MYFNRLLIANRGEIVTRVARTARRLGMTAIGVASDADLGAPHAQACDLTVPIGGAAPAESYLRADRLLAAARASGAQAVHPGYGFLSEHAAFAQAVLDAGLVWIGPPPQAMRAMGDKANARRRMAAAGVPVLPGYDGDAQDAATLHGEAVRIGAPLMVKASAGGGGRGMRLVRHEAELHDALASAQAEAQAAFGDARVLLERALLAPRHLEVQVFADTHGTVLHLGERDCSVQRRHQKLIEEAPSPAVTSALRRRMGEVAVRVAREIGYVGAGTVEFLLDADGGFWFMEMNTRLQVEHPVTEALLGVDLVEWQLRVARGEALPIDQQEALRRFEHGGHAIEVRLCAENPAQGFLPQAGRVLLWSAPDGVRCDHALASGCEVSAHYDSMLAKLIAHGTTRGDAMARLAGALDRTACLGLPNNRGLLARMLRDPAFASANVSTAFIAEHYADDAARANHAPSWLHALAAAASVALPDKLLPALWSGWRSSHMLDADALLQSTEGTRRYRVRGDPLGEMQVQGDAGEHTVHALVRLPGDLVSARIDGRPVHALLARDAQRWCWLADGAELEVHDLRLCAAAGGGARRGDVVHAPMHGRVTQVHATAGAGVEAGALLIVMEAMKMEHRLHAPRAGTLKAMHVAAGEQVAARQLLVEMLPMPPAT